MARKGPAALQIEIENEEDWENLVEREGLIIVDVYSEWCGPCTSMIGHLRKIKMEYGGDILTLATAKCDNIPCLSRFVDKSQPTWMFIANQRMIRLMFGANAPLLMRTIIQEIAIQRKAVESGTLREGIDFDELTEEEQIIVDEETEIREEAERTEREAKENAITARREEVVHNLLDSLAEFNFVMLWPHVDYEGVSKVNNAVKETPMQSIGKTTKTILKDEDLCEMLYYCNWEFTDLELQELQKAEAHGLLFQRTHEDVNPIQTFLDLFYGEMGAPPGDEDCLAMKLSKIIRIKVEVEEKEKEKVKQYEDDDDDEDEEEMEETEVEKRIPGLYVPENENCKVLAMRILFPLITAKFDLPEVEPTPPQLIIAFDASKRVDVLQCAEKWPEGTVRLGFFTSIDPEKCKLICKTGDQFERLPYKPYDAKLIVQVSKKKSEPLLSYGTLGPIYVSPNTDVGGKECAAIFPEDYDKPDSESEPEPEPQPAKRTLGSDDSGDAEDDATSEERTEGEHEGDDENEVDDAVSEPDI